MGAFGACVYFKFNIIAFLQGFEAFSLNFVKMYENIFAFIRGYEAVTLFGIEPFDLASGHYFLLQKILVNNGRNSVTTGLNSNLS